MSNVSIEEFREIIWQYYHDHGRSMPWRDNPSPYAVVMSEFMLQQTQVARVTEKFVQFMDTWPDWARLAAAPRIEVVAAWKGLGYNRRALWLHGVAQRVTVEFGGILPDSRDILESFRGIGPNTAGAIMAYAFNAPVVFVETNIRRVFIHHFMGDRDEIHDRELIPFIEDSIDREHPREWYWALMDYGSFLATQLTNPNRRSKHHTIQNRFEGSRRQLRGKILEILLRADMTVDEIVEGIQLFKRHEIQVVLNELTSEGFLAMTGSRYTMNTLQ